MKRNPEIGKELETISPAVANLSFKMPFYVPEGYFESFPHQLLKFIKEENIIGTETTEKVIFNSNPSFLTPFSVPEGYFDGLSANILSRIKETGDDSITAELQKISPVLAGFERKIPFIVPENYFENLDISSAIVPSLKETGRVVSMGTRKRWMNYAAAAVITAVLAGAVYFFMQVTGNSDPVISNPMAQNEIPVKDSLEVSPEALSSFLSQTEGIVADEMIEMETITGQKDLAILSITENTIQEILNDLPDHAIQDYMSEYPEVQLNTNSN
jgi:hypothetical protein